LLFHLLAFSAEADDRIGPDNAAIVVGRYGQRPLQWEINQSEYIRF